jgi:hypothetical protein
LYEIICSLCGFEITEADEDELVECKVANLPTYGITLTVTGEKAAEPGIVKCHGRRAHPIVLHHECVDYAESLASGSLRDLAGAAVTIRGSFNEPGEMCDPHRRWLENTVTQNLFQALCGRLPKEICRYIAVYCVREQSIQFIHERWSRQGRPRRGFISVPVHGHTTLWAKHTHFEGIRYIQSFSYDSQGGDEEMLIKGNTEEPLNVFNRHKHLGVNKVVITEGQERPEDEEVDEQWWTCHAQQTRPFHFKARFDVSVASFISWKQTLLTSLGLGHQDPEPRCCQNPRDFSQFRVSQSLRDTMGYASVACEVFVQDPAPLWHVLD